MIDSTNDSTLSAQGTVNFILCIVGAPGFEPGTGLPPVFPTTYANPLGVFRSPYSLSCGLRSPACSTSPVAVMNIIAYKEYDRTVRVTAQRRSILLVRFELTSLPPITGAALPVELQENFAVNHL